MLLNGRKRIGWLAALLLALTLLPAPALAQTGITATPTVHLRVRSGPDTAATQIGLLPPDAAVSVVGRNAQANWLLVEIGPGQQGWIAGWWCVVDGDASSLPVARASVANTTAGSASGVRATINVGLNLRAGAGTGYAVLGVIPRGARVPVLARHNVYPDWIAVDYNGTRGFVLSTFAALSGGLEGLPFVSGLDDLNGAGIAPAAVPAAFTGEYKVQLSNVGPHLLSVFQRGQALGSLSSRFSKIGDSETDNPAFLVDIDREVYDLGERYAYLQPTINHFAGSFEHIGPGAEVGMVAQTLLDPLWADPRVCSPGENRIACEYRVYRPSVALILVRTEPRDELLPAYEASLKQIVEISLDRGVIPVLSTVTYNPTNPGFEQKENAVVRQVAAAYNVPLWDLYATTYLMPNHGINESTAHLLVPPLPAFFAEEWHINDFGAVRRNLEALEVLHAIYTQVMGAAQ